ncbi:hypothetical protein EDD16DRAFT_1588992 [Pisolithus croceorrhizus]|nr:hypothetical protein EDD16DRAFT_1588992 [Pisolithus croceorrhizus]KAI6169133.1 hypothetical protein EDD17DRAFT_1465400 [Pisolithus thermaeus]
MDSKAGDCETSEYDPAYEWLGDNDIVERTTSTAWPPLRLLVLQSSILHKRLRVAVLDAYGEAQFGRDHAPVGSAIPRIRLKEMEVSKLHATAYWDKGRREWAVVDMGSMHGTFLQSGRQLDLEPIRLSPPRVASIPRPLCHLDRLVIGSTTFLCHIHEDRKPCVECMSNGQGDIPLFTVPKGNNHIAEKRTSESAGLEQRQTIVERRDPKKALTTLKRALLSRHHEPSESSLPTSTRPAATYVDRSARRRAMYPASQYDSPGVQSPRGDSPGINKPSLELTQSSVPHATPHVEAPRSPGPLPDNNIGRKLLLKQGWKPGQALGSPSDEDGRNGSGLVVPLEVTPLPSRAGLGMPDKTGPSPQSFHQWREESKERRWESMKATVHGAG